MKLETQISLGDAITFISVIVGLIVIFVRLGRWGERLETRMLQLESRIDTLNAWAGGFSREITTFMGVIVQLLHRRQALNEVEMSSVVQGMADLNRPAVEALFQKERLSRNPLTAQELDRLQAYVTKLRMGQWLTQEEALDYNQLVSVLEQERPTDPGVWPLVALGAFLAGLLIGSKEQPSR